MKCKGLIAALSFLALGLLPLSVAAQQPGGTITGTVTSSESGQVLSGVTVTIKGTRLGAITESNGRYLIPNVPAGSQTVSLSMIGYADQDVNNVPVVAGHTVVTNVEMVPQAISLAQVVVVAYGRQQKATITGSVASVSGQKLAAAPVQNLQTALTGTMSGVIVNTRTGVPGEEETSIRINGAATLPSYNNTTGAYTGVVEPLYVIDGVPDRNGGYTQLNPNDIQSITVLKDASAAIYGAQAGAGVILITTKEGRGAPKITYTGNFGFTRPTWLPQLVNAHDYAVYENEVRARLGESPLYTDAEIQKFADGSDPLNYPNYNWINAIIRDGPAPQEDHTLQISGSTDKLRYFLSGRYNFQHSILRNSSIRYRQYEMRSNLSSQLQPDLQIGLNLYGRWVVHNGPNTSANGVFQQAARNYPTTQAIYPNGYVSTGVEFNNPVVMLDGRTGYDNSRTWYGQSQLNFRLDMPWLTRGLYVSGMGAFDLSYGQDKSMNLLYDQYQYDKTTGQYVNYKSQEGTMNLSVNNNNEFDRTLTLRLGWDRAFGKHQIQSFAAYEQDQSDYVSLYGYRQALPSDQIQQLFVGSTDGINNNSSETLNARQHYFGRVSYSYADRYLAEFTLRHDGSPKFPPQGRWGTFPGASVGWRISDEGFFKALDLPAITDLKLKASWGIMGNDQTGDYQYLSLFSTTTTGAVFGWPGPAPFFGLRPGVSPNPDITWERVEKENYGLEATLWNGRVSTDLNYFRSDRTHILMSPTATVPAYTGLSLPAQNLGEVRNHGFDGSATVNGHFRAASWHVSANLTYAKSKIIKMNESPNIPSYQKMTGHQAGTYPVMYKSCGIFRSQAEVDARPHLAGTQPGDVCFVDVNGDGVIDANDQILVDASPDPNLQYGLDLGGTWGRFSLDMLWQGQGGSKILVDPMAINATVVPPQWMFDQRWTPDHPNAPLPASFDRNNPRSYAASTFWLKNATFFRLRTAEISYDVPERFLQSVRLPLDNVKLTLSGYNLFTFSGIKDYDPELNRVNTYYYPQQRVFNFSITTGL